ncbi:MAG: hypothetical protein ABL986_17365 [Vicinamibacterales bacterium]
MRAVTALAMDVTVATAQAQPPVPVLEVAHQHGAPALFSNRESSGTAWVPEITPMYGVHRAWAGWEFMAHGNAFLQFIDESGDVHRRGRQVSSINWVMGMARRPLGTGRVGLRAMVSLEPWTIRGCGYPNLLATGEVCEGDTIHDRQHPHDLFMELAADYDRPLRGALRWQVYAAPAGEPAIGPPGFPHRASAVANPIAPITHHWLDATHITFGVVTTGIYGPRWRAEASLFNGREPDAARMGFDLAALDSFSGRFSLAPSNGLSVQLSAAHLHEAEAGVGRQPRTDVNRVTASAMHERRLGVRGTWATTLAYGVNSKVAIIPGGVLDELTHAVLLETSATIDQRHSWFGRVEVVSKPAHDLHVHEYITEVFTVAKLEVGYVRHARAWHGLLPGIGGVLMGSLVPAPLAPRYGGRVAPGFGVFLTVRPVEHPR